MTATGSPIWITRSSNGIFPVSHSPMGERKEATQSRKNAIATCGRGRGIRRRPPPRRDVQPSSIGSDADRENDLPVLGCNKQPRTPHKSCSTSNGTAANNVSRGCRALSRDSRCNTLDEFLQMLGRQVVQFVREKGCRAVVCRLAVRTSS
jgi:hypothetical protein